MCKLSSRSAVGWSAWLGLAAPYCSSLSFFSRRLTNTINAPPSCGVGSTSRCADGFRKAPTTPAYKSRCPSRSPSCANLPLREPAFPNTLFTRSRPIACGSVISPTLRSRSSSITPAVRTAESHSFGSAAPAPRIGRHRDLSSLSKAVMSARGVKWRTKDVSGAPKSDSTAS